MNEKRTSKKQLFQTFARLVNALANPHRLELIDLLVQAPRTVEELSRETGMTVANTSQHLQRLKQGCLVKYERDGLFVHYHLAGPEVAHLWLELRRVADHQLAEVDRALSVYRPRRHDFSKITIEELQDRMSRHEIVLLDVRPGVEYQAGHLSGAVSIPLEELEQRLEELPLEKLIVTYCRGPFCVFADEALEVLEGCGWDVARLEEGVAEWQFAGNILEK